MIYIIFSIIPIFEILVFETSRKFDLLFERDFRKLFRLAFLTSGSTPFMIGRIALIPTYAALMKNLNYFFLYDFDFKTSKHSSPSILQVFLKDLNIEQ